MRQERRVGADYDNDGTGFLFEDRVFQNLLADRHPRDGELLTPPAIRLNKRSDRVSRSGRASLFYRDDARSRAVAAFELVGDHARAAADATFLDGAWFG